MNNYKDYLIRNGQLVGQFEEMYKNCEDPWLQSEEGARLYSIPRHAVLSYLKKYRLPSVLEMGCGFGHLTHFLNENGISPTGVDISATAILKAQARYPYLHFVRGEAKHLDRYQNYGAILFSGMTWFVLPELEEIWEKLLRTWRGKYFFQTLSFCHEGEQGWGKEYFTTPEEFIARCPLPLLDYTSSVSFDDGGAPRGTVQTCMVFRIEKKGG